MLVPSKIKIYSHRLALICQCGEGCFLFLLTRPTGPQSDLLDAYRHLSCPTLLLWADEDAAHPLAIAEEALDLLPHAQLRVLEGTGFLMAYDDPVGLARELKAFCV